MRIPHLKIWHIILLGIFIASVTFVFQNDAVFKSLSSFGDKLQADTTDTTPAEEAPANPAFTKLTPKIITKGESLYGFALDGTNLPHDITSLEFHLIQNRATSLSSSQITSNTDTRIEFEIETIESAAGDYDVTLISESQGRFAIATDTFFLTINDQEAQEEAQEVKPSFETLSPNTISQGKETYEFILLGKNIPAGISAVEIAEEDNLTQSFASASVTQEGSTRVSWTMNNSSLSLKKYTVDLLLEEGKRISTGLFINVKEQTESTSSSQISEYTVIPSKILNNGETPFDLKVRLDIESGVDTIQTVQLDTSGINGFGDATNAILLEGEEKLSQTTQIFSLRNKTVQKTVAPGIYELPLLITLKNETTLLQKVALEIISHKKAGLLSPQIFENKTLFIPENGIVNDGKTPFRVFTFALDPDGYEDIRQVVADLSIFGQNPTALTQGEREGDGSHYSITTTVDPLITPGEKEVTFTVFDFAGNTHQITKKYMVLKRGVVDVNTFPVIENIRINPEQLINNNEDPFTLNVLVNDPNGGETVESVVADLSALGLDTISLAPTDVQGLGHWYTLPTLTTIPTHITPGQKTIVISTTDTDGHSVKQSVPIQVIEQKSLLEILRDSYVQPDRAANDGRTPIKVLGLIRFNENSGYRIASVVADLNDLKLGPVKMHPVLEESTNTIPSTLGARNVALKDVWYSTDEIILPSGTKQGGYEIEIRARDTKGELANQFVEMYVVDKQGILTAPRLYPHYSYTRPKAAFNDGITPVEIWAFASDPDGSDDIVSMNIDLRELGGTPANQMNPAFTESDGRWYSLKTTIPPSITPGEYEVKLVVTDKVESSDNTTFKVRVIDSTSSSALETANTPPRVLLTQSIARNKVEIVFDRAILQEDINRGGDNFRIAEAQNLDRNIDILEARIGQGGQVITLITDPQTPHMNYALEFVTQNMRDTFGNTLKIENNNSYPFLGFKEAPQLTPSFERIFGTTENIDVTFDVPLQFSLFRMAEPAYHFTLTSSDGVNIPLQKVEIMNSKSMRLTPVTDLINGQTYSLSAQYITSHAGKTLLPDVIKASFAIGNAGLSSNIASGIDLNNDGKMNFSDFTLFSKLYRTYNNKENAPTSVDLNSDGKVGFNDFTLFAKIYRRNK
jgi:hypothetical protein